MYSEGYFLIMGYISMCSLKRYGVSAVLVINRVSNFGSGRQSRLRKIADFGYKYI